MSEFTHVWRLKCRLPERKGQPCRVLVRGKMGSIMIEFQDGARYVVGWRTIRKRKDAAPVSAQTHGNPQLWTELFEWQPFRTWARSLK